MVPAAYANSTAMLQCKIAIAAVTIIKDGKAEIFGGIQGGATAGDEIVIQIDLIKHPATHGLKVTISPKSYDLNLTMGSAQYFPDKVGGDYRGLPNLVIFDGGGFGTDEITMPNVI